MLIEYFTIGIFIAIAIFFACFTVLASHLLGRKKPSAVKQAPYECGMPTVGSSFRRIPVKYYIIAMLFLLFDIEVVFLYPWAVISNRLGLFGLIEMVVFVCILLVGYFYILGRGALRWD